MVLVIISFFFASLKLEALPPKGQKAESALSRFTYLSSLTGNRGNL